MSIISSLGDRVLALLVPRSTAAAANGVANFTQYCGCLNIDGVRINMYRTCWYTPGGYQCGDCYLGGSTC